MSAFLKGLVAGISLAAITAGAIYFFREQGQMKKYHDLQYPLMLQSSVETGTKYLLPQGTRLYFDKSFPEGFTRYKVYVNIDGVQLNLQDLADPTAVAPLTAYPVNAAELRILMQTQPITAEVLRAILKSSQISREEIRELLKEYAY